LGLTLAGSKG